MHQRITFERWSGLFAPALSNSTGEAFLEGDAPPGGGRHWASANFTVTATPGEDTVALEASNRRGGGTKTLDPVELSQDGVNKASSEVMRAIREFRQGK